MTNPNHSASNAELIIAPETGSLRGRRGSQYFVIGDGVVHAEGWLNRGLADDTMDGIYTC